MLKLSVFQVRSDGVLQFRVWLQDVASVISKNYLVNPADGCAPSTHNAPQRIYPPTPAYYDTSAFGCLLQLAEEDCIFTALYHDQSRIIRDV